MIDQTLAKIKLIETQAVQIVTAAKKAAALQLKETKNTHEQALTNCQTQAQNDEQILLQAAEADAKAEAKDITSQNRQGVEDLKQQTRPKAAAAKKEILKCL